MRTPRALLILLPLLLLCVFARAAAELDDMELHEDGGVILLDRRQESNGTASTQQTQEPTSDAPDPTSEAPPTSSTSTTSTRTTATTPTTRTTATTSPTTPAAPATTATTEEAPATSATEKTTSSRSSSSSSRRTTTTLKPTPTTRVVTTVITTRIGESEVVSTLRSSTTGMVTPTAILNASEDGNGGSSGLTKTQKNVVIGVVVGVGGAIILGGLGIVLWRLRKKKTNPVDDDDLMRRDGSPLAESGREMLSGQEASPFQATLDQYHKPPGQVNASSNF